ncbi:MAG: hypothetical protein LAP21_16845 [Acidobacteriia bacterium]|nr:hypothetical protein [Terriglobia bacterium]
MKTDSRVRNCLLLICCLCGIAAAADTTITGKVRNETSGQPAAGDNVLLLRLDEGMQQEAQTKTDAQGAFAVNAAAADARYIVRVMHQGVNYDQMVIGKNPLEIKVFDAVAKIPGLNGNMGIAQLESDGKDLKVAEMYSIRNVSSPPVTQFSPRNFDISLPAGASLDSVEVKSGNSLWVNTPPVPLPGQPGRYSLGFPLRPGNTLFKFKYHLPQQGPTTLRLRLAYPIERFAVVHPPSMLFRASRPGTFKAPGIANGLQLEEAMAEPVRGEVPAFVISGAGAAPPPDAAVTVTPPVVSAPPPVANDLHAQPATAPTPPAEPNQDAKALWPVISAIALVLALSLFVVWWMKGRKSVPVTASSGQSAQDSPLAALKEELFRLEADHLNGSISAKQYDSARKTLNENIQRAMAGKSQ